MNSSVIKNSSTTRGGNITSTNQEKNDKQFRDNLNLVIEKIEQINDNRINVAKNIKLIEQNSKKFYDEAKVVFKNLKTLRNNKLANIIEEKTNFMIEKERGKSPMYNDNDDKKFYTQTNFYNENNINNMMNNSNKPYSTRNPKEGVKGNFRSKSSKLFNQLNIYLIKLTYLFRSFQCY